MNEKLVQKIQKLLALATSPNENEAKAASAKANALLIEHKLSMQEVENANFDYVTEEVRAGTRGKFDAAYFSHILNKHFFVTCFQVRSRKYKTTRTQVAGEKTNVEIAKYTWSFLEHTFSHLWTIYKHEMKAERSARQPFYLGLTDGFIKHLDDQRSSILKDRQIVLVQDPGLVKYIAKAHPGIKTTQKAIKNDEDAYQRGHQEGQKIRVARGIESNGGFTGRFLR